MRLATVLLAFSLAASAADSTDKDEVIAVVNKLFAGMAQKNAEQIQSTMTPDARLVAASDDKIGTPLGPQDFVQRITSNKNEVVERMWDPTVLVRGRIAMLWAEYDVHIAGKLNHCGIDSFMLLKTDAGWKISDIQYTSQTQGCKPPTVSDPGERRHR